MSKRISDIIAGARGRAGVRRCVCGGAALLLAGCGGSMHLSFLNPQGPVAAAQRQHFWLVSAILFVLVAFPVFVGTVWIARRYRYGSGKAKYTPRWKFYTPLECFTWAGPVVIVLFLATLVWRNTDQLDPYRAMASDVPALHVQVVGYDWKWLFVYPDLGIASVGTLAFPAGRPLALDLTTATVMQSFFIPALGSQIYAMGGMVTKLNLQADRPGRFLGENTMYSGDGFHGQKFAAVAMSADDFGRWAQAARAMGQPLDAGALRALSAPGSKARLRAALPRAVARDGAVYFAGVAPGFFHRLVSAVRAGRPLSTITLAPVVAGGHAP